ncbi:MAG: cation diffusion facilitator family transporter [Butyricicoccaceae bacterium]
MTNLLLRILAPQGPDSAQGRQRYGQIAGCVGIAANLLLFVAKLLIGLLSHSIAVMADAGNNLSDALSSLISVAGFYMSGKAPDKEHPFGHGRTEYIAGLLVSVLILFVGFEFAKSSIERILNPSPVEFSWVMLGVLVLSMLVKLWMGLFNRRIGREIQSKVLMATMQDSINDVITTGIVVLGMIASRFTSLPVDGYIGVIVAVFLLRAGYGIAKETFSTLIGEAPDPELAEQIRELVLGFDGVLGVHDLIVHNYGVGNSVASIHAEVSADSDFIAVHEVIDLAEKTAQQKLGVFLVIHMDPIMVNDVRINQMRSQVQEIIGELQPPVTMHDFRVVDGEKRINLIFDVVVPYDCDKEAQLRIYQTMTERIHALDERYHPVITMEHAMG